MLPAWFGSGYLPSEQGQTYLEYDNSERQNAIWANILGNGPRMAWSEEGCELPANQTTDSTMSSVYPGDPGWLLSFADLLEQKTFGGLLPRELKQPGK